MNDAHYSRMRFGKSAIGRKIGAMMGLAFSAVICAAVVLWLLASSDGLLSFSDGNQDALAEQHGVAAGKSAQDMRAQRGLESELAQTIMSIHDIESARVFLAMPRQSSDLRKEQKPGAWVMVKLKQSRSLDNDQIESIAHLVSSRLPLLAAEHVRVVDQDGRVLNGKDSPPENYLAFNQLEYKKNIEEHLTQRIINILTPVVGSNGMRVQLSADVDFSQPEVGVSGLKNEQTAEEKINQAGKPARADAIGIQPAPAGAALDKTIRGKSPSAWDIRRLTVAVVLDDRHILDTDGKIKTLAYTPEAISQLNELVKQAVGIDGSRGDRVAVKNVAFRPAAEIKSGTLITVWERAWFSDVIKMSIAVVTVIFLLFGVLRPVARGLMSRGAEEEKPADQAAADAKHAGVTGRDGAAGDKAGSIPVSAEQKGVNYAFLSGGEALSPFTAARGYPKNLQDLQNLVEENPKLVAQIIQSWIRDESFR